MNSDIDVVPHLQDLWRYARVLTRDDADADDLVQDALTRALSLGHTYDRSRPLGAWLMTVVRNTFLTGMSRRAAETRRMTAVAETTVTTQPPAQESRVALAELERHFRSLPLEQAEVLHVVAVQGYSYREAAELLGIPIGTVMSRLNRGRTALRDALGDPGGKVRPPFKVVGGRDEQD